SFSRWRRLTTASAPPSKWRSFSIFRSSAVSSAAVSALPRHSSLIEAQNDHRQTRVRRTDQSGRAAATAEISRSRLHPAARSANCGSDRAYTGIEFALPTNQGLVVQFVAATSGRDSEQVALDMAWAAASALHKRVLVLTCSGPSSRRALRGPDPLPANDGARIDVLAQEMRMMKVAAHEMYVADIGDWYGNTGALGALDEMDIQLAE